MIAVHKTIAIFCLLLLRVGCWRGGGAWSCFRLCWREKSSQKHHKLLLVIFSILFTHSYIVPFFSLSLCIFWSLGCVFLYVSSPSSLDMFGGDLLWGWVGNFLWVYLKEYVIGSQYKWKRMFCCWHFRKGWARLTYL